jgi:hypothetical protein
LKSGLNKLEQKRSQHTAHRVSVCLAMLESHIVLETSVPVTPVCVLVCSAKCALCVVAKKVYKTLYWKKHCITRNTSLHTISR